MTQVDRLRAEGITGKGIRIGVVDTGVDYRHPALGGCFGPGCIIEYGFDLVGENYSDNNEMEPDSDPLDACQGHGTHVVGIIAAQENELGFTGVAPDVRIGAYRVSGCPGYLTNELIIAAFNMAYEDGSDIISCSAGDDSGWASDPTAVAASRIAEQGVPVLIATGNSGNLGVWQAASPASGVSVNAVGSVENSVFPTLAIAGQVSSGNGSTAMRFGWRQGSPPIADGTNVTMPLVPVNVGQETDQDACSTLPEHTPDLANYISLVRFSTNCTVNTQAANIFAKGGKLIMFYPLRESDFTLLWVDADGIEGVGVVSPRQGAEWADALATGQKLVVTLTDPSFAGLSVENLSNGPRAGYISSFSSWGPTWEVELKPQFLAPGGSILSTWTWDAGEYAVNPGTSMSTPFAAGVFALVGQARGTMDPTVLRNVISSTSKPNVWHDGEFAHDILAPVAQQGAGLIQAYDAAKATLVVGVSGLSCNDSDHFVASHSFSIENTGSSDVTYSIGHSKAATVYTYSPEMATNLYPTRLPPTVDAWASVRFEAASISVPAGGSANVTVTITPPSGVNATLLPVYGGYITLNGTNGENHSVPYLGVAGSLHDTRVLSEGYGVPGTACAYLSSTVNRFLLPVSPNTTFTIPRPGSNTIAPPSTIYPRVVVVPSVGMPRVRIDVVAVGNSTLPVTEWFGIRSLGQLPIGMTEWRTQLGLVTSMFGNLEDGTILPSGSYRFVVSALRIFGNDAERDDWDIVEFVPFTLNYLE